VAGDDGKWYPPPQPPEEVIGEILPGSLHQYFFFDGERIEKIVRADKKAEIAEATKMLLGVEVLNRSIKHLGEAKKSLENELKAIGDLEIKQLVKEQQKLEKESDRLTNRQKEIELEIEHQQTIKKETNQLLRELSAAKELQLRRQQLEEQKALNQENLKKSKDILKRAISSKGYTVLLGEVTAQFCQIIENLRQRGELKPGISRDLIDELLKSQHCLCGNELLEGSASWERVISWQDKAGIAAIEETTIRTIARVDEIDRQVAMFWEEVDREQANISQFRQVINDIEQQLDKIQEKLRTDPSAEIRNLQKRLDEIEEKIRDLTLEQGADRQQMINFKSQIEALNKQILKQNLDREKQALAQRRIAATQEAIERLTEVRNRQERQFRWQLEQRVREIFTEISFTPYVPKISEKYELTLVENTAGIESPVAASTGENQILSLSFIGGIIDRVREWSDRRTILLPDTSTFPIVMDSPFGSLDEIYRRQIAKIIPQLANQLVVLVTKTQWRGEVAEEIADRVGREYVLIYYSSKPDCEEDSIELGGVRYPLVRQSPNEFEYTEIVEVDNGF
jgi:DNA sulfur modification protein DndD